jgi:tagatose-1,6-bisphosphate aldolase
VIDRAAAPAASDDDRRRRLLRLGGSTGVVAGIALDHRDTLRVVLERDGLAGRSPDDLRELKLRLTRVLAHVATAIMLDAELGGRALAAGAVPPAVGLVMPLEAQGYEAGGDERVTTLLEDFAPADARRLGADACKVFLPYRVDDEGTSARQDELVRTTARACHAIGLPLVVEPVPYRRSTESPADFDGAWERLVIDAVARLRPAGIDLFKLPFPVPDLAAAGETRALDACRALDDACGGIPWVLLGAGADTETFLEQVRLAGTAGATGFLAGRGIWGPALADDPDEAERRATEVSLPAFASCRAVAERSCRPLPAPR